MGSPPVESPPPTRARRRSRASSPAWPPLLPSWPARRRPATGPARRPERCGWQRAGVVRVGGARRPHSREPAGRPAGRRESENEQAVAFDRPGFERGRLTRGGEHATELVLRERFTGGRDDLQCATLGEEQSDLLGAEDLGHGVHHKRKEHFEWSDLHQASSARAAAAALVGAWSACGRVPGPTNVAVAGARQDKTRQKRASVRQRLRNHPVPLTLEGFVPHLVGPRRRPHRLANSVTAPRVAFTGWHRTPMVAPATADGAARGQCSQPSPDKTVKRARQEDHSAEGEVPAPPFYYPATPGSWWRRSSWAPSARAIS